MSGMSDDGDRTCPLCAEEMDLTDQQLKPCKCGYEICVWFWHHIMEMAEKEGSEGRCPACRSAYDKLRIVGAAANCKRMVAEISAEKKQKSQKTKNRSSSTLEDREHLSTLRVMQRNLVCIMGMPSNLADENILERREYFGQYGKVLKVSISRQTSATPQHAANNNTYSVYITYAGEEEAVRCIQAVQNFILDGNPLRSRVPQIPSNELQPRAGNVLPPPTDDMYNIVSVSNNHSKEFLQCIARAKISAPPGFSAPNRARPPGFSTHDRYDQAVNSCSETQLLRGPLQDQSQVNSSSSVVDVEFIDPAILAVGKGRLSLEVSNTGLGSRSAFHPQFGTTESNARFQLLTQQSISAGQEPRIPNHIGDRFLQLDDALIASRFLMQHPNLSPFGQQLSHQQPVDILNSQWNGWNDIQIGNGARVPEVLRNETFGL